MGDFADLLRDTVTVEEYASEDDYGAANYGSAADHACRTIFKQHLVKGPSGRESLARGTVLMEGDVALELRDRLTLSDGTVPPVLAIDRPQDERGNIHHTRVHFG